MLSFKIWDFRQLKGNHPLLSNQCHSSAVKAMAWCPWEPTLLATGGGICDQTLRLWNSMNGKEKAHVQTESQVTSILWSEEYRYLVYFILPPKRDWEVPHLSHIQLYTIYLSLSFHLLIFVSFTHMRRIVLTVVIRRTLEVQVVSPRIYPFQTKFSYFPKYV